MYAVIRTGGKQYRVGPGDIIEVEKLPGQVGETVVLDDVLLVANGDQVVVGQPRVDGARVEARITGQYRGEKILVFRYRPKKRIRVRRGHRQYLTRLQIRAIHAEGFESAVYTEPKPEAAPTPEEPAEEVVQESPPPPAAAAGDVEAGPEAQAEDAAPEMSATAQAAEPEATAAPEEEAGETEQEEVASAEGESPEESQAEDTGSEEGEA